MMKEVQKKSKGKSTLKLIRRNAAFYVLLIPSAIYIIVFCYFPMYGIQMAFRDFKFADGITGSKWVGLKWLNYFLNSKMAISSIINTLILSLYSLLTFPAPIILALIMHNLKSGKIRKTAQTITYFPHFISTVVLVGMMSSFFSINSGWVNQLIEFLGGERVQFMQDPKYFRHMYIWAGVWQGTGWGSIIYMAALAGVDPTYHEAAMIDGASRIKRIWHVDIPTIVPTIIIMLILRCGSLLGADFEKAYLMQNPLNIDVSEVISTYTYKQGLGAAKYSYGVAIGFFNNVVNLVLLTIVNFISGRVSETKLW